MTHKVRPTPSEIWLERVSQFAEAELGLYFPRERWRDLERCLWEASEERGEADLEVYCRKLVSGAPNSGELAALCHHLTVGETYFFREMKALEALTRYKLPELNGRAPRIWSAGCATGEEAYSIAIHLQPHSKLPPGGILATDLNDGSLERARKGVYRAWAFRATSQRVKTSYFSETAPGRWTINPEIRRKIHFEQANLVKDTPPEAIGMDVIFCRNVLMYFSREAAQKAVRGFHRALTVGGWLILGAAEVAAVPLTEFTAMPLEELTLYCKGAPKVSVRVMPVEQLPVAKPVQRKVPRDRTPAMMRLAQRHADRKEFREASKWCEKAMAGGSTDFRVPYLRSAILQEQGQDAEAARMLRQVLFLEPKFIIGNFALANLQARMGKVAQARQGFANTLKLLEGQDDAAVLPESDGLTAGRLREIISRRKNG
jgi:chemotaxis protein methyltransferase CheR